ncbi:MAG TPA: type III pantothenate kinase [Cyclobacteriaceae bacterium]|nr:type III pantothenate kinase [Cyclobacteriaceae bacterium]
MFLSIDAGNSNIVFGFFDPSLGEWRHEFRVETARAITAIELGQKLSLFFLENNLGPGDVSRIGISSVVPEINPVLVECAAIFFGVAPYLINGSSYGKLRVSTHRPNEIGSDLMANMTAAYERFEQSCIIVDFGTALTFSVVDEQGRVAGVNIVPGLKTAVKSLFINTSKLPEVKLELPSSAIGQNTVHAIQAGVIYGYTGLVKGMLATIKEELGRDCKVIATGGMSKILTPLEGTFDEVDRNLTLKGIKLITEANL